MSDHEIDRRYNDQQFKLGIVKELAEVKTALNINTTETKETKQDLGRFHEEFNMAIYGNLRTPGLAGDVENLWKFLKYGLVPILFVTFFFGEQLNPILKDWLYEHTKMKIFYSPEEDFKKKKGVAHETHYIIRYVPSSDGVSSKETDSQ